MFTCGYTMIAMLRLLENWGLEKLASIFQENEISDLDTLGELMFHNKQDFEKLFPLAGVRAKLQVKYKAHINLQENIQFEITDVDADTFKHRVNSTDLVNEEASVLKEIPACSESNIQIVHVGESSKKKQKFLIVQDYDLLETLNKHTLGPSIINYAKYKGPLNTHCQSHLCQIIVLDCIKKYGNSLTNDDYEELSNKICELFPNECTQAYFIPQIKKKFSKNNKSERSKGKLVDKFRNTITFIRENSFSTQVKGAACEKKSNLPVTDECVLKSKLWLRYNRDVEDVTKHWDFTYELRLKDTANKEYKTIDNIFENWPILKDSNGYQLIERDFLKKYSIDFEYFSSKWDEVFYKLLDSSKKKLPTQDKVFASILCGDTVNDLPDDYKVYMQLHILSTLLASKSQVCTSDSSKKKKFYYKPNSIDCREGIFIHVKIPGDIEYAVGERRKQMSMLKQPTQPFIIAVGENIENLNKFYIRIDSVTYEIDSFLKAIDIIYKIFITYNVDYPTASENLSYFIQWGIYNITTKEDEQIPSLYNILNRLQLLPK